MAQILRTFNTLQNIPRELSQTLRLSLVITRRLLQCQTSLSHTRAPIWLTSLNPITDTQKCLLPCKCLYLCRTLCLTVSPFFLRAGNHPPVQAQLPGGPSGQVTCPSHFGSYYQSISPPWMTPFIYLPLEIVSSVRQALWPVCFWMSCALCRAWLVYIC